MKKTLIVSIAIYCLCPVALQARQTTLSGGLDLGYELFDRTYTNNSEEGDENNVTRSRTRNDDDYSRILITPLVSIVSESVKDSLKLEYAPSLVYDLDESENDIDHKLMLDYRNRLTRKWEVILSDNFINTDQYNTYGTPEDAFAEDTDTDPLLGGASDDRLRDESGRRRYYKNSLSGAAKYTYRENSHVSFGYVYDLLRNEETESIEYEDYDKHNLNADFNHRFDSRWSLAGSARYIRGLYDTPEPEEDVQSTTPLWESIEDDLHEYHFGLTLSSEMIRHQPISLSYNFTATDYDADLRDDGQIHDVTLGYRWLASPHLEFSLGAGPTYTKQDNTDDEWDVNGYLTAKYTLEKSVFSFSSKGGTEYENFSGTDKRGTTVFWETRLDYTRNLLRNLSVNFYGYYRNENRDELDSSASIQADNLQLADVDATELKNELFTEIETQQYALGAGLTYAFMKDYTASISYGYVQQDSDRSVDEYEDHRLQLNVAYKNDFLKW